MSSSDIIRVEHLHTQFGEQVIHKDISFSIKRGEILGIVGGSGSGKSVLLSYLMGLDNPQKGKIVYLTDPPYPDQQIGVLFQKGALVSSLTVLENIMLPMKEVAHLSPKFCEELAYIKLEMVGLPADAANKYPSKISGGMIKRVAMARAMALDPEILFLDEPTSGLDPVSAQAFDQLTLELKKRFNITVIMITHDLGSLRDACDRIAVLVNKNIVVGTLEQIMSNKDPWIQNYFCGDRGKQTFQKEK